MTTRNRIKTVLALAGVAMATLAFTATSANADAIAVSDVYGHNEKDNYDGKINDMIIGSGMNGYGVDGNPGWPVGEGDPSTWTATSNGYQSEWQSQDLLDDELPVNDKIGWAAFDLGAATANLDELYLWNVRENSGRYTKTFNVYVAETPTVALTHGPKDGTSIDYDFSSGGWTLINTGGPLNGTYRGNQVVSLGGNTARYVAVEILSNNGDGNRVGLAEVGITVIPEPSTFCLTAFGLLGLLAWRRRR